MLGIFKQASGAPCSEKLSMMLGQWCRPVQAPPLRRGLCVRAEGTRESGTLAGYRVVLVSPQEAGNVGSVCRLAANFGKQ